MLNIIKQESLKRNNLFLIAALFIFFFGLYVFLDFEGNTNYKVMINNFGFLVVVVHITINLLIAGL